MNELAGALSNPFTVIAIVWLSDAMHISSKRDRKVTCTLVCITLSKLKKVAGGVSLYTRTLTTSRYIFEIFKY